MEKILSIVRVLIIHRIVMILIYDDSIVCVFMIRLRYEKIVALLHGILSVDEICPMYIIRITVFDVAIALHV